MFIERNIKGNYFIFIDKAIYLKNYKTLIISDTHIGYKYYYNDFIAKKHLEETIKNIEEIKNELKNKEFEIEKIIINGDIKDAFGYPKKTKEIFNVFNLYLKQNFKEAIYILGNHDTGLKGINSYEFDNIFITHGDKNIKTDKKIIIIGHQHPGVKLKLGTKTENYKCFIICKKEDKNVVVLPNFSNSSNGSSLDKNNYISPYLKNIYEYGDIIVLENKKLFEFNNVNLYNF